MRSTWIPTTSLVTDCSAVPTRVPRWLPAPPRDPRPGRYRDTGTERELREQCEPMERGLVSVASVAVGPEHDHTPVAVEHLVGVMFLTPKERKRDTTGRCNL